MILVAVAALSWLQVFLSLFSNVISHTLVTHCRIHLYDILPILYFQPSSFVMLSFYTFDLGILLQSLRLWASIFFTHWCFTPCTYFPHFGTFVTQTRAGISYLGYFSVTPLEEFSLPSSAWAWTTDFWVTRPLVCLIALNRLSLLKVICKKNKTIWRSVGERYCL